MYQTVVNYLRQRKWTTILCAMLTAVAAEKGASHLLNGRVETGQALMTSATGTKGTIEFTPVSGTKLDSGLILLNDQRNYKDPSTVCVVVDSKRFPKYTEPSAMTGRTWLITGHTSKFKDRPQIVADDIQPK